MICPHCGMQTSIKLSDPAEYRRRKVANIKRSLEKAKANGTKLGRPRAFNYDQIVRLRHEGLSYREIALEMKCSTTAVQRALGNFK